MNPRGDPNSFVFCDDCPRWPVGEFLAVETTYAENFFTNVREAQSNIADALQPLLDMKAVCNTKGIRFFAVLAPDQLQIDKELAAGVMERGYQPYARYWDPEFPNRIILEILRSNGIEVLDLLPSVQATGELKPLYLPRNTHWNIAGNRLAADQICAWLAKQVLFVPAGS